MAYPETKAEKQSVALISGATVLVALGSWVFFTWYTTGEVGLKGVNLKKAKEVTMKPLSDGSTPSFSEAVKKNTDKAADKVDKAADKASS